MNTPTKYTIGTILISLVLLGFYNVVIKEDRIEVKFPDSSCGQEATLRVTKDDFTLKCGWRIAFQADTIVEYYKTYGLDEWVRNNRYVGRNKKDIELSLTDFGDYFVIERFTRYRKGKQSVTDGWLTESYKFTKEGVKITYNYEVENKAKHKISMRIKKEYLTSLDMFDPFGNTGIRSGNLVYYEGFGDLLIDPTVHFTGSPANESTAFQEGDTIAFKCNVTIEAFENITNVSLWHNMNGTWLLDETTIPSNITNNLSVTYSKIIPHQNAAGNFSWNCEVFNGTGDPFWVGWNNSIDPYYLPNAFNITHPELINLNLLNSTGWGSQAIYPQSLAGDMLLYINWTNLEAFWHPDEVNMTWNITIAGTSNTSSLQIFNRTSNGSNNLGINVSNATWDITGTLVDDYFITLIGCSALNTSLCISDTTTIPLEIFDYNIRAVSPTIRFSPQSNVLLGHALGQTSATPFFSVDWFGSGFPTGLVNISLNYTQNNLCLNLFASLDSDSSSNTQLDGNISTTVLNVTDADPDSIWLFGNKSNCGTTTTTFSLDAEVLN